MGEIGHHEGSIIQLNVSEIHSMALWFCGRRIHRKLQNEWRAADNIGSNESTLRPRWCMYFASVPGCHDSTETVRAAAITFKRETQLCLDGRNLGYHVHDNAANNVLMKSTNSAVWCVASEGIGTRRPNMVLKVLCDGETRLVWLFCTAPPLEKHSRYVSRRDGGIDI